MFNTTKRSTRLICTLGLLLAGALILSASPFDVTGTVQAHHKPDHAGGPGGNGDDPPDDAPSMFVEFVFVSWTHSGGPKKQPNARVWIVNEFGEIVPGALVEGVFLGGEQGLCFKTDKEASSFTDVVTYNEGEEDEFTVAEAFLEPQGSGINCSNCDFVFVVTNIAHPEYVYDPELNLMDQDSTPCSILD